VSRVDLDAVQARVDAATEGPWAWEQTGDKDNSWAVGCVMDEDEQPLSGRLETGQGIVVEGVCEGIDHNPADAEFIAHARTDVPALIAELRVARDLVEDAGLSHVLADAITSLDPPATHDQVGEVR
jgi:hypothetical protein